ncbi:MAG: glycosyl hydrolase 115 family protein [Terracidiphilus sp.]
MPPHRFLPFDKPLPRIAAIAFLPLAALSMACAQTPHAGSHTIINQRVTIVESPQEPGPVRRATQDLLADFAKVFGRPPRLVDRLEDAGPVAILIADRTRVPPGAACATTADSEAFAFSLTDAGVGPARRRVVCLTGADMRGTIYAIYQFSQTVLGVDPMYLWTGRQPEKRAAIALPADFARVFPGPVFRYRGFFINDEDLLSGWIPAPKGAHTGISLKVWDNIFETILRLKGNMIVPGTWIFPDDAQVAAASERGLIVNQHHAIPLGVNVARWPQGVPYNFSTHPEILERAWTDAVATYTPDEEILWSVGLRGLSDSSYASLDPSVRNNDPLLGERISQAVAEQIKIVRARYPNAQFVTDLWQEGARLMREGYLKIPPEVTLVWADTGYGDMQDGGDLKPGEGMYIHDAMMNGMANQLSEMVPVERLQEELGRYIKAGATSYVLLNTSDIRPVAMTARAVMDTAWGGAPKESDAEGAYYRAWATEEFGAKSADALEKIYKEYFAAPALRRPFSPPSVTSAGNAPPAMAQDKFVRWYGDNFYHSEARRLILDTLSEHQVYAIPSQSPKWSQSRLVPSGTPAMRNEELARDIEDCSGAQPRWDAVWEHAVAAEKLVDPDRRNYYQAQVLTMIAINRESNLMLLQLARAMQDDGAGQSAKAEAEAAQSLQSLDAIRQSMDTAEYGKWKNWYRGDWLTGVYRTHELVQDYANHLRDPMAKLPAPAAWSGWEGYFHIMEYEDDRTADVR